MRHKEWKMGTMVERIQLAGPCYITPAFSGVPTKGTKSKLKTYTGGHHDAPRNKAWIQRLSRFPQ